jgi:hypothetical protein
MSEITKCQSIISGLETKRAACLARSEGLAKERDAIAYDAHAVGDPKSRAKLDKLNLEGYQRTGEIASIETALKVARQRLAEAEQAEQQAQGRGVARELLKRAARLVELAQTLDDANRIRGEVSCAISEELQTMRQIAHGLGVFVPSEQQFLSLGSRAEQTTLMKMPFHRIAERLAPNEKRNHSSYAQPWRDQIVKGCAALLGDKREEAA